MNIPSSHRLWSVPVRRWGMFMRWHDLMFMHWDVPIAALRPLIPAGLELDTFDGRAWLGVVPFRMSGIRHRFMLPVPGLAAFPEINVRTYVKAGGKPGVWFFSLDATSRIAVRAARWKFHLPYFNAQIQCRRSAEWMLDQPSIDYFSRRTHRGALPAAFEATYRPTGEPFGAVPGTLEFFLTERYCLYAADRAGNIYRGDISHAPWSLRIGEAQIRQNSMTAPLDIATDSPPILHYAADQDVVGWTIDRL